MLQGFAVRGRFFFVLVFSFVMAVFSSRSPAFGVMEDLGAALGRRVFVFYKDTNLHPKNSPPHPNPPSTSKSGKIELEVSYF